MSRFSADSTATEVVEGIDLSGKLAVVTGGASGIGRATVDALASAGATVVIGARNRQAIDTAVAEVDAAHGAGRAIAMPLDLVDPVGVRNFADAVAALDRPLDLLIANSGIMACPEARTADGLEMQLATNFLGHALLTSMLMPLLKKARGARLISLSSMAHHLGSVDLDDINFEVRPYEKWAAYGQSKTACSLLAVKAAQALKASGGTAFAVNPGKIWTGLMQYLGEADLGAVSQQFEATASTDFKTVESGAATTVWAATSPALLSEGPDYMEDCAPAVRIDAPNGNYGVLPFALDATLADGTWKAAEALLRRPLPL